MKHKIWNTKNSYGGRTFAGKDIAHAKDTLMLGQRATLYSHNKDPLSTISHNGDLQTAKETKFDQLKKEIKNLQTSQFLSMKYRCNTEPDSYEDIQFRLTGKEFMPSKKIAQLERYKMHLRNKGKTRKISLLLERNKFDQGKDPSCINLLEAKDININNRESNLKRKETPSIVKKYYRPQTGHNHRSMSELPLKETEVRGRGLKSSSVNRAQKQNILIYCF